ncbi:unnamed protein product [Ambrosiozyma monospora]|uniref:Unnamed protein product n=1 Tax=Ambrosiozyma monospora TaxID=43982 RepID=A0ACB5TWH2_AMBMO|nr:unnamed protein product [Ambrosiozyma monospora]
MILFNKNDLVGDKELRFIQEQTKLRQQQLQEQQQQQAQQQAQCNSASTADSNGPTTTTSNGGGGHRHNHSGKLNIPTRGRRNSQASITASQKKSKSNLKSKSNSRWLLTKSRYQLLLDYIGLTQLPQSVSSERGSFLLEQDTAAGSGDDDEPEELFFDVGVFIVSLVSEYSEGSSSLEEVVDWIVAC